MHEKRKQDGWQELRVYNTEDWSGRLSRRHDSSEAKRVPLYEAALLQYNIPREGNSEVTIACSVATGATCNLEESLVSRDLFGGCSMPPIVIQSVDEAAKAFPS